MKSAEIKQLIPIFEIYPEIKLVYFFGSRAKGESGPLSDYDFGIYTGERKTDKIFASKFSLQDKISRALGTDKVDVVMMDVAQSPELKYGIIKDGELIYEKEPYRVLIEPRILNEYFDFRSILLRSGLAVASVSEKEQQGIEKRYIKQNKITKLFSMT